MDKRNNIILNIINCVIEIVDYIQKRTQTAVKISVFLYMGFVYHNLLNSGDEIHRDRRPIIIVPLNVQMFKLTFNMPMKVINDLVRMIRSIKYNVELIFF